MGQGFLPKMCFYLVNSTLPQGHSVVLPLEQSDSLTTNHAADTVYANQAADTVYANQAAGTVYANQAVDIA